MVRSLLIILFIFCFQTFAAENKTSLVQTIHRRPFVPEKFDYQFELGTMWEKSSLYWVGGQIGMHLGKCLLTDSKTCQNYVDVVGGVGGRKSLTAGMALLGIRWQFVNFPSHISPSIQLLAGAVNIRDDQRDRSVFTGALGYGITTAVHEKVDLKIQARVGYSDEIWSQAFVSIGFKADEWVEAFAKEIQDVPSRFFKDEAE